MYLSPTSKIVITTYIQETFVPTHTPSILVELIQDHPNSTIGSPDTINPNPLRHTCLICDFFRFICKIPQLVSFYPKNKIGITSKNPIHQDHRIFFRNATIIFAKYKRHIRVGFIDNHRYYLFNIAVFVMNHHITQLRQIA